MKTDIDFAILKTERDILVKYLIVKTQSEDWHGVADAAMDLREIDAKLELLQSRQP